MPDSRHVSKGPRGKSREHRRDTDGVAAIDGTDAEPPQWLRLEVLIEDEAWSQIAPEAESLVTAASSALSRDGSFAGEPAAQACVALSNDATVHALNRSHRGKDRPTNVLSFPAPEGTLGDDGNTTFLGDVIIAAETLAAEARSLGIPTEHHLQHLVVHGLLHLLGFDHETGEQEAAAMEGLETRILASLGVSDPYAEPC